MGLDKKVNLDIDGDGKPDLNLDLKSLVLVIGGIISITMTYSTLTKQIERGTLKFIKDVEGFLSKH